MLKKQNNNFIAFIEVPLQALSLKSLINAINVNKIVIVKRRKWSVDHSKFSNLLNEFHLSKANILIAFISIFFRRLQFNSVILPSHLGKFNKLMILICVKLYKSVIVLDDGNFSFKDPDWLEKKLKIHKNLKWFSCFNTNKNIKNLINFSFYNPNKENYYKNTTFLLLPDFVGLDVDESDERRLISEIKEKNLNNKLVVLPHRRGRYEIYKQLNLDVISNNICFEHWYTKSNFENCRIYSAPSSANWALQDARLKTSIICKNLIALTEKEKIFYEQFTEFKE